MSIANAKAALKEPPKRRRINVDGPTAPTRPLYEIEGEKAFLANRAKNAATSAEKSAKDGTLVAMVNAKVEDFMITVSLGEAGNKVVDFTIDREDKTEIDVQELYKLVLGKEISMEDFVSVVKVSGGAIKDKFGSLVLAKCTKTKPNEDPSLVMKPRK